MTSRPRHWPKCLVSSFPWSCSSRQMRLDVENRTRSLEQLDAAERRPLRTRAKADDESHQCRPCDRWRGERDLADHPRLLKSATAEVPRRPGILDGQPCANSFLRERSARYGHLMTHLRVDRRTQTDSSQNDGCSDEVTKNGQGLHDGSSAAMTSRKCRVTSANPLRH